MTLPERSASLSACGVYRYSLGRHWDDERLSVAFVMLNPSTADAMVDDPTIRKCVGFARRLGFGSLTVVNLYAFRATNPAELVAAQRRGVDIVGVDNDRFIGAAFRRADAVVFAWGSTKSSRPNGIAARAHAVVELARSHGPMILSCLSTTESGEPRHPLMLPYAAGVPAKLWSI